MRIIGGIVIVQIMPNRSSLSEVCKSIAFDAKIRAYLSALKVRASEDFRFLGIGSAGTLQDDSILTVCSPAVGKRGEVRLGYLQIQIIFVRFVNEALASLRQSRPCLWALTGCKIRAPQETVAVTHLRLQL